MAEFRHSMLTLQATATRTTVVVDDSYTFLPWYVFPTLLLLAVIVLGVYLYYR